MLPYPHMVELPPGIRPPELPTSGVEKVRHLRFEQTQSGWQGDLEPTNRATTA
jgi:hypothetical protein